MRIINHFQWCFYWQSHRHTACWCLRYFTVGAKRALSFTGLETFDWCLCDVIIELWFQNVYAISYFKFTVYGFWSRGRYIGYICYNKHDKYKFGVSGTLLKVNFLIYYLHIIKFLTNSLNLCVISIQKIIKRLKLKHTQYIFRVPLLL